MADRTSPGILSEMLARALKRNDAVMARDVFEVWDETGVDCDLHSFTDDSWYPQLAQMGLIRMRWDAHPTWPSWRVIDLTHRDFEGGVPYNDDAYRKQTPPETP